MAKSARKKKLDPIPKINRRLFRLWSLAVRERTNHTCEYCGIKKGDINHNNKPTKIDAHHLLNRDIKNCPLKFDIRNGIAICPTCHKFSPDNSFHNNPIVTIEWLKRNKTHRYEFVLAQYKTRVNLQDRDILAKIEQCLNKQEPLNLEELTEIHQSKTTTTTTEGSLFD